MVVGLPQHVRRHRAGQPGREDADDRLASSSTSTGSPTAIDHLGKHQLDRIEPTPSAETDWVHHVNQVAD